MIFTNARKRLAARIGADQGDDPAARLVAAGKARADHWATRWRRADEFCLYLGYALVLTSAGLRLVI